MTKTAYIFPGQGSQFPGMAKELYPDFQDLMEKANQILGFRLTDIMFEGSEDDLRQTRVTQPAIFLHSVLLAMARNEKPDMVAGHSLGEFSALVAAGALSFEDGLRLVALRASQMQKCCEEHPGAMAAVIALPDSEVEKVCASIPGVVPANYNSPGQVVISGEEEAVKQACKELKAAGAKRALRLPVSGAFHSPLMQPAREALAQAIGQTPFQKPFCPVYQNVTALPTQDPAQIQANLLAQLTSPVRWTQIMQNMYADGARHFLELGPGTVLQGLAKRILPVQTTEGDSPSVANNRADAPEGEPPSAVLIEGIQ